MLLYLLIGVFLYSKKLVGKTGSADMSRMLLYVVMPSAIIRSYMIPYSFLQLKALAVSFLAALLTLILSIIISRLFFSNKEALERFGTAFSNAGFIGIPLVQMTIGEDAVFYVSSFVALLNILQWTYGVFTLTGDYNAFSFRKLCNNPVIISLFVGLLCFFIPVEVPTLLSSMIGTLASMNAPLAMIILGIYMAQLSYKSLFNDRIVYKSSFIRLIIIPICTLLLLGIFPKEYRTLKLAVLIAASAPIGSNVAIFAQLYEADYTLAVKEVCLSTLLCIITMPAVIGLASYLF